MFKEFMSFFVCSLLLWAGLAAASPAAGPQETKQRLVDALQEQIYIQKKVRSWSQEKQSLVNEILSLKTRADWYLYQNKKYRAYIQQERQSISELENRMQEMKTLRMKLEPYLDQVITDLESLLDKDMTFLVQERSDRIQYLKESMKDYHLSMSEKLRRVLEALQVEAQYGRSTEVSTRTLNINGQSLQVQILRVGRVARFYRSLGGEKVGRWNQETKSWEPLSQDFSRNIKKAMDMAEQKQAVELVELPIGGVEQ